MASNYDNFEDLDNPIQALLNELERLEDLPRRRRVYEKARELVGEPQEVYTAWRDALVAAGYVRFRDFQAAYEKERNRREQATQDAAREAGDTGGEGEGRGPSQATQLVRMALDHYDLGITRTGTSYAVPRQGARLPKIVAGGSGLRLRPDLEARYYDEHGTVPNAQALTEAMSQLASRACREEPVDLHLRVARFGDDLIVHMGDDSGRVVRITSRGWQVLDQTPGPLFGRTKVTAPLPEPARDGTLADLRAAVNVTDDSWPQTAASLVQALIPDGSHPAVRLSGPQGAGKSTRARRIIALVDPSAVPLRKPPKDDHGWTVAAGASWVIALDNVSTIPGWLSDSLCRAVTGEGDIRRSLYTDSDLTVFEIRRCLVLTSIDVGSLAGDLADRLLAIECEPISDAQRREDADLDAEWADLYPKALGALYELAVKVLAALPHVRPERLPRMADYARILAAVDHVLDNDGAGQAAYYKQAESLAGEVLDSSPIAAAIVELVKGEPDRTWTGTPAALLDALKKAATVVEGTARRTAGWPTSPRGLTAQLTRLEPALKSVHKITVTRGKGGERGRSRLVTLQGEPPEGTPDKPAAPTAPSATVSDQHERADGCAAGAAGRPAADSQPAAQQAAPDTPPDLHERPSAAGADGADGESRLCGGLGSDALREPEDGHVASPGPEVSADPNEPMDLAKMKAILLAEGARRRASVNGGRPPTFEDLPDEEP